MLVATHDGSTPDTLVSDPAARDAALDLRLPVHPVSIPSRRPWAGRRLGDGVGELWLAGPDSIVETGDGRRVSLDRLAQAHREQLIGSRAMALLGPRFPLLVKLIDAAAWLSLQVHPSDAVAAQLEGPGSLGKAEAWVVVEADHEAELITGPRAGLAEGELRSAIETGSLGRSDCTSVVTAAGDAYLIRAGTIHAIGPGLLVYEIEQPSDLTYRISDWGRPATPDRPLHARQALRAVTPGSHAIPAGHRYVLDGGALHVREFRLEIITGTGVKRHPAGRSLEIVTAVGGGVLLAGNGWTERLAPSHALVVPAAVPGYAISAEAGSMAFVGSVP